MEKTILVAIDGSVYSGNSLEYLANLFGSDSSLSLHLFGVVPSGGGGKEWMFDVDPLRSQSAETDQRASRARKQLRDAEDRLVRGGISRERIATKVRIATSVSGAIRDEAKHGNYDSVVIGRRGLGSMGNVFFGSISGELVEKCHNVPLWIVDGRVSAERFLLAVHSRPSSLLAADHLAYMLKNRPGAEICLYHSNSVFGAQQAATAEEFHLQWGKEWCDKYLDLDNFLFYAHCQLLVEGGISRSRIRQLPAQMHLDVGSDLLRQAKQHGCGTIVIGRRRRDLAKGQLKGVSDKTLKQAQDLAVWLAG
ncbi:universal stress protein [Desulfobulbus sp.]|uniref:universal stress protein n=1 Tax=Desulfobulbus sp. TaxID=895 RepID=UPI00286F187C|nr:universal stress protein [Desulfobulbus sp.]